MGHYEEGAAADFPKATAEPRGATFQFLPGCQHAPPSLYVGVEPLRHGSGSFGERSEKLPLLSRNVPQLFLALGPPLSV